ncbi:TniQ family protein [Paraburkholderia sediminicola]|uniref:TniQ family protein n=1 Tax=Paraburkholderia sediminicola TaxID=458836 RepID=UPI0038BB3DE2
MTKRSLDAEKMSSAPIPESSAEAAYPVLPILYPLKPKGIGTGQCESIVSYLCRLANEHHFAVDILMNRILSEIGDEDFSNWQHFSNWSSNVAINISAPQRTSRLLAALEASTGVLDISNLSLRRLSDAVDLRGSSSVQQHHCPECFRENSDPLAAHRPMIWDLSLVRVCPIHHVPLISSKCGAPQSGRLSRWRRFHAPGICATCGSVGYRCCATDGGAVSEGDLWVANEMAALVSCVSSGEQFFAIDTHRSVIEIATSIGDGYPYRSAKICGFSKARLFDWINATKKVRLGALIALCAASGVSVVDALRGRTAPSQTPVQHQYVGARNPRRAAALTRRALTVREAVIADACPSLRSVAESLGISIKYLEQSFPEESKKIVLRRRQCARAETARRQSDANMLMREIANELAEAGRRFTKRNIWLKSKILVTNRSRFEASWLKINSELSDEEYSVDVVDAGDNE